MSWTRRSMLGGGLALGGCATLPNRQRASAASILAAVRAPRFPPRSTRITDHGARQGRDCALPIAAAIAAMHDAGGGRVVVPPGLWPANAPVDLRSNVELHLQEGAHLRFGLPDEIRLPIRFSRWEGTELFMLSALVRAENQRDIAITGPGRIDGQGRAGFFTWRPEQFPHQAALRAMGRDGVPVRDRLFGADRRIRPYFVQLIGCENVLIDGPEFVDSPFWMVHPLYCRNVIVRNARFRSKHLNSDGVDPDSSTDVLIERCTFDVSDDCVAIKSGRDQDGWRVGRPTRRVVVRDCSMTTNIAAAFAVGSEMSGGASDIHVTNLRVPQAEHAIYLKANRDRGGVVERVTVADVQVDRTRTLVNLDANYKREATGSAAPTFRDIDIRRVRAVGAEQVLRLVGLPERPIEGLRLVGVAAERSSMPSLLEHTKLIT